MAVLDSEELMCSCGGDGVGVAGDVAGVRDERLLLTPINEGVDTGFKLRNWVRNFQYYRIGPC